MRRFPLLFLLMACLVPPAAAQDLDPAQYASLHFRHIGPVGNRVSAVAGVAGDPMTYYAGSASGGVFKTEDGGLHWTPIFDDTGVAAIGAVAVAPSDPNVVWVGTGEGFLRSNVSLGNGMWRSTDAGETWTHIGLPDAGRIPRIVVHPRDADVAYVAVLGHTHAPQAGRGVWRTTDGGVTWTHLLAVDVNTGAADIAINPSNPRILFASMWQVEMHHWLKESGGPGSGLHVSRDGGDTWTRLEGHGLPTRPVGKIALCIAPDDADRIYALIETGDGVPWHGEPTDTGELWRSDDGGRQWKLTSYDRDLAGRSAYYSRCAVAPDDRDEVYFLSANFSASLDGGVTNEARGWFGTEGAPSPGWDHHDMWIAPDNADRMAVSHDGGVSISENRGASWLRVQLPNAQMYHVTTDNAIPYTVCGNRQDGPSMCGPSNSRVQGLFAQGIPRGAWFSVGGGESGFATPDPTDPNIIWSSASGAGAAGGIVVRYDRRTGQFRHTEVWPEGTFGVPASDLPYRFQWTFPLLISPHDTETVYVTSQHVHRTTNRGQTWETLSPDLTTADTTRMGTSGGLTPDNIGVEFCCVIYAFDESPVQPGVFWAGTNDGLVHVSRDAGASWTNVTANLPGLPPHGVVRNIDASKWNAGKAYLTVEHHLEGDFTPRVYKTENYGARWTLITNGLPEGTPLHYTRNVREDPLRPGLLYLGTETGLFVSFDDGGRWQPLQNDLPPAPMYWLQVQEHFNDLVVGTYGRGFWILDDLTPLQQLTPEVAAAAAHLFAPRPAYRFRPLTESMGMLDDPTIGEDPKYGASLNVWLAEAAEDSLTVRITDAAGDTVRTLHAPRKAGLNRLWWDLRSEPSTQIKMRTPPEYAAWVPLGKDRTRNAGARLSVLSPPGVYTVTLEVDGQTSMQTLEVRKDPNSESTEADVMAQTDLIRELRSDLGQAAGMVNRIELLRRQLLDLDAALRAGEPDTDADVLAAIRALEQELLQVERHLIQTRVTGTGQDGVRWPVRLVGRLGYLAGTVETADFPPTDSQYEVHEVLRERLQAQRAALDALLQNDLPALNRLLRDRAVAPVI